MFTLPLVIAISTLALPAGDDQSGFTKPVGQAAEGAVFCFCSADFDHSGEVDGADLGHLLGDWGTPGSDCNGSGTTDGADLGILLGQWGTCGAIPTNDHCEDALIIGEGTIGFCTNGATTSGPAYTPGSECIQFGYDNIYADIWYSYTPTEFGYVTVSTCGTSWDTRLALYTDIFPGGPAPCPMQGNFTTVIDCNDDFAGCDYASQVSNFVYPDQEYLIRVGGYSGHSGQGTLKVDFTSQGQTCEDAINMGYVRNIGQAIEGSTLDNDPATDVSPCGTGDTIPEWYYFGMDCTFPGDTLITVSTCNAVTDFDTVISVWAGLPGTGQCLGEFMGCNDDSAEANCQIGGFNRKSKLTFVGDFNQRYYVRVSGYLGAKGNFRLTVGADCP